MSLGVTQLLGFGAGGAIAPASVTLTDNSVDSVNRTVYTFSSQSLGAAAANRKILVVIFSAGVTGGRTINSVTVAGSSASKLRGISDGEKINEIWVLDLTSGTTGDVVVTFSASKGQCGIGVYRLLTDATAAFATASVVATGPSTTLDVPANGIAILGTGGDSGSTSGTTLTGVTEVYDEAVESGIRQAGGLVELPGGETGRTMASVGTTGSLGACTLVCASYGILAPTPVTVAYTANTSTTSSGTSFTFSSVSLGTAASNRKIVVGTGSQENVDGTHVNTITVGGVSATGPLVALNDDAGIDDIAELWIATVPTGTTGDIVVTMSGDQGNMSIGVWAVFGASSTAHDTVKSAADPGTGTINVPAGGVVIAEAYDRGGGSGYVWTGPTEDFDGLVEGGNRHSGASKAYATIQTSLTVTANLSTEAAVQPVMVGVSLAPG